MGNRIFLFTATVCIGLLSYYTLHSVIYSLEWPLMGNVAIFQYIGWYILHGGIPYKEIMDINLPGVYVMHAAAIKLFGNCDLCFHKFDWLVMAVTSLGIIAFLWPVSPASAVMAGLLFSTIHQWNNGEAMGERDFLMTPFLIWGAYCLNRYLTNSSRAGWAMLAGFLLGMAMWIKPTAALALLFCAALMVALVARSRLFRGVLYLNFGAICVSAFFVIWLLLIGAIEDFTDIMITILPLYNTTDFSVHANRGAFANYAGYVAFIFAPVLFAGRFWKEQRNRLVIIFFGVCFGLAHWDLQGKFLFYHHYPLIVFSCLYFGMGAAALKWRPWSLKLPGYVLLIWICWFFQPATWLPGSYLENYTQTSIDHINTAMSNIAPEVRTICKGIQFISYTHGELWRIAYFMDNKPPVRHMQPLALEWRDKESMQRFRDEFYNDFIQKKPCVIVTATYRLEKISFDAPLFSQPWNKWFNAHYRYEADSSGKFWMYVRTQ